MVYLIHFERPYKHARHYLGFVARPEGLDARLAAHAAGNGARLLAVVNLAGIAWRLVRTWPEGTRADERRIKNYRCTPDYCPVCRAALRRRRRREGASR